MGGKGLFPSIFCILLTSRVSFFRSYSAKLKINKKFLLFDMFFMFLNHLLSFNSALLNNSMYLTINFGFNFLAICFDISTIGEWDIAYFITHSEFSNYLISKIISFGKIIICTCCNFIKEVKLSTSSTQNKTNSI